MAQLETHKTKAMMCAVSRGERGHTHMLYTINCSYVLTTQGASSNQ